MSDRRAEPIRPQNVASMKLCAVVPLESVDTALALMRAGRMRDAYDMLRAWRTGPGRRLMPASEAA